MPSASDSSWLRTTSLCWSNRFTPPSWHWVIFFPPFFPRSSGSWCGSCQGSWKNPSRSTLRCGREDWKSVLDSRKKCCLDLKFIFCDTGSGTWHSRIKLQTWLVRVPTNSRKGPRHACQNNQIIDSWFKSVLLKKEDEVIPRTRTSTPRRRRMTDKRTPKHPISNRHTALWQECRDRMENVIH